MLPVFILICCCGVISLELSSRIVVDVAKESPGVVKHFWTSTGLCPPAPRHEAYRWLLSKDYLMNLVMISALPYRAISHVRIHWLLELVSLRIENSSISFKWNHLDSLLDWMQENNLFPGFELMGNPSGFFSDFDNETQVYQWQQLISTLADRYVGRYGAENVSLWRFETWNEPDLKVYNIIPFSLTGYLRYWGASVDGLKGKWSRLRIGGPAGLFKIQSKHPLCWGFLSYCARTFCPVDFLSFHKKGNSTSNTIVREGVKLARKILSTYPQLRGIPLANDEADPLTGWSHSQSWRSDVRYGAMVAYAIVRHHQVMIRKHNLPIEVISNDNGFLNYHPFYFSQRTLLARFQMNNTNPPHIQFIQKPVYATMGLLSLLGNQELHVSIRNRYNRRLVALAASSPVSKKLAQASWNAGILLAFSNDTEEYPGKLFNLSVLVRHLPSGRGKDIGYTVWLLDNERTNPSHIWQQAGAPVFPDQVLRQRMRAAEGPFRIVPVTRVSSRKTLSIQLHLSLPSVALVHMCQRASDSPGQVMGLKVFNVTFDEVLLKWDDSFVGTRCIKTYEVQFSPSCFNETKKFKRINVRDIIFLSFQNVVERVNGSWQEEVMGLYRVRAVDFWNRPGKFSAEVCYSS